MSAVPDLSKMDEKNASLTMKLVAKSGYRSEVKAPAVSAAQWGAIQAILAESHSEIGRQMMAIFRQASGGAA